MDEVSCISESMCSM